VLGEIRLASSVQYSERLFHSIEFLFQHLPVQLSDIDVFAAARGPVVYGLRIGLAAMEAFVARTASEEQVFQP
jgi:tRNA A37 threonylcarbamoyladenosine modification protein TsaB